MSAANMTPYFNSRNEPFYQVHQYYPISEPLFTNFEKEYDSLPGLNFVKAHPEIPVVIISLYLAFCYFGQKFMKNREPFDLKWPLAYWNLFLSTFSTIGMMRTVPHLLHTLSRQTMEETICTDAQAQSNGDGVVGLWVQLFVLSKIPELIDTVFIVLRKKPLIFLHWYHHITVLAFCWNCYATKSSTGLIFCAMNYSVHAIMYGYYFLMAVGAKPKWMKPVVITLAQISQMIVGTTICIMSAVLMYKKGSDCAVTRNNILPGALMYGSYLYLFCEFAVKRFILAPKKKVKKIE